MKTVDCIKGQHDEITPEGSNGIKWCRQCGALCVSTKSGEQWRIPSWEGIKVFAVNDHFERRDAAREQARIEGGL